MKHSLFKRYIGVHLICVVLIGVGLFSFSMPETSEAAVEESCGEENIRRKECFNCL